MKKITQSDSVKEIVSRLNARAQTDDIRIILEFGKVKKIILFCGSLLKLVEIEIVDNKPQDVYGKMKDTALTMEDLINLGLIEEDD